MIKPLVKKAWIVICLLTLLSLLPQETNAQCAMCRATVENNVSSGENSIGAGLNKGILFLLATPYAAFCVIAYFWYRNSRREYEKRLKTASYVRSKASPV
jgi:hypothetical protein